MQIIWSAPHFSEQSIHLWSNEINDKIGARALPLQLLRGQHDGNTSPGQGQWVILARDKIANLSAISMLVMHNINEDMNNKWLFNFIQGPRCYLFGSCEGTDHGQHRMGRCLLILSLSSFSTQIKVSSRLNKHKIHKPLEKIEILLCYCVNMWYSASVLVWLWWWLATAMWVWVAPSHQTSDIGELRSEKEK